MLAAGGQSIAFRKLLRTISVCEINMVASNVICTYWFSERNHLMFNSNCSPARDRLKTIMFYKSICLNDSLLGCSYSASCCYIITHCKCHLKKWANSSTLCIKPQRLDVKEKTEHGRSFEFISLCPYSLLFFYYPGWGSNMPRIIILMARTIIFYYPLTLWYTY